MFDLTGKQALVTGAGSGIGKSAAEALASAGATVYVSDVNEEPAAATVAGIQASGGDASFIRLDVAAGEDSRAAREVIKAKGHTLSILVNNAGIGKVGTILETGEDDLDAMYRVNVKGVFHTCRTFLPDMIEAGGGSIINIASIGGVVGVRDRLAYCMSKFAVVGMTKTMALDHAMQGVRVNCICPGRVETEFVQRMIAQYDDPEQAHAEMSATQAIGRMGRPDEVAAACVYLASDEAECITGSSLMIDGGWSAGK